MGWWEKVEDFGATSWEAIKATPEYLNPLNWLEWSLRSMLNTMNHTAELVFASRSLVQQVTSHPPTQRLLADCQHVIINDVLPMTQLALLSVGASSATAYFQSAQEASYLRNLGLSMLNMTVQFGLGVYSFRQSTRKMTHEAVIAIESASMNKGKPVVSDLCTIEQCSGKRILQGKVRDLVEFYATQGAINAFGQLPIAEAYKYPAIGAINASHVGRFIIAQALPELCSRHLAEYCNENAELVWAIGLTYTGMGWLLGSVIPSMGLSYLPPAVGGFISQNIPFKLMLSNHLLLSLTTLAIHMKKPAPISNSTRGVIIDPVVPFRKSVGLGVDITLLGLKKWIPQQMRKADSDIDWMALLTWMENHSGDPLVQGIKFLLLDECLHNLDTFRKDPVVTKHWKGLRTTGLAITDGILSQEDKWYIKGACYFPSQAGNVADFFWGLNAPLVRLAISLINDKAFMERVRTVNRGLKFRSDLPVAVPLDNAVQLARPIPEGEPEEREQDPVVNPLVQLPPPANHPSNPLDVLAVITDKELDSNNPLNILLQAQQVATPSTNGVFAQRQAEALRQRRAITQDVECKNDDSTMVHL